MKMPSPSQLLGVKLKPTHQIHHPSHPSTLPATTLSQAFSAERANYARLRACDLEAWYPYLKDQTFPTVFVPLLQPEAEALVRCYWSKRHTAADVSQALRPNLDIASLEARISQALHSVDAGQGVFAKLSSRSAKDSHFCEFRAFQQMKSELQSVVQQVESNSASSENVTPLTTNRVYQLAIASSVSSLRLTSAADIIQAFVTSERVCEDDLPLALSFPKLWSQHIVLRRWVDIPSFCEVRGFVYDARLTALSQYFSGVFFPELVRCKERIMQLVVGVFQQIIGTVKQHFHPVEMVMDFAVDLERERVYLIELNPFGKPDGLGTGTILFDMNNPADRDILFGKSPFEFRVRTEPASISSLLHDGPLKDYLRDTGILQQLQ